MVNPLIISALIFLTASCVTDNKPNPPPQQAEFDENEPPQWAGPGWYWGIYIDNEDDYWNDYNDRYLDRGEGRHGSGHGGGQKGRGGRDGGGGGHH